MNALLLALSLSNSFTKVGAIAALAVLVGIALLSLLVFSQAREIKRLREWAGRAPERAAEREQRIPADASAPVQRQRVAQTAPSARVIPRATPLVSAPVSSAVSSAAAAATNAGAGAPAPASSPAAPSTPAAPSAPSSPAAPPTPAAPSAPSPPASPPGPSPSTAAARAARAPLPPSPAMPSPATPAPAVAGPPRTAGAIGTRRSVSIGTGSAVRRNGQPDAAQPAPSYYKRERSAGRATILIVGAVIAAAVAAVLLLVPALKGGSSSHPAGAASTSSSSARAGGRRHAHARREPGASNPADTSVTVLNGTSTAGLAHHLAANLQQSGYTRAAASAGVPSGPHASTVVEYASGHRADARRVARALNVMRVQPIDGATAALAGSASVVVVAGDDQAAQLGGGGAQSHGEPAASGGAGAAESAPAA